MVSLVSTQPQETAITLPSGEEKPQCTNCERQGETCDYSIRLNWSGRKKRRTTGTGSDTSSADSGSPYQSTFSFKEDVLPSFPSTPEPRVRRQHTHFRSNTSPYRSPPVIDPALMRITSQDVTSTGSLDGIYYFPSSAERPTSAPYKQAHFQNTFDVRSHTTPGSNTFCFSDTGFTSVDARMPPPQGSVKPSAKRQKYAFATESPAATFPGSHSPHVGSPTPYSPYMAMPLTPISVGSEGPEMQPAPTPQSPLLSPPDLRRVSVQSLINDEGLRSYGIDLGLPDRDTPRNDDFSAIAIFSPRRDTMDSDYNTPYGSADTLAKDMAFESGGYYAKPVPIRISKALEPLPPLLMANQMNLLYFHHFLNHTARSKSACCIFSVHC
jgi:hypothetical protein